jgi:hypothetical protein
VRRSSVGLLLALAGCAADGGDAPLARPTVNVRDQVGPIDRARIVGAWQCRDLNPYPDQVDQIVRESYAADGSYRAESHPAPRPPLGALVVTVGGTWAVAGDKVVTSGLTTEARSADGNADTDLLAGLGAQFVNSYAANQADGAADVLELGPDRLVLRPVGVDEPPVIACTR